jgi:hypothetical protein
MRDCILFFFKANKGNGEGLQWKVLATPKMNRVKKMRIRGIASEHMIGSGPFSEIMCTNNGTTVDL